MEGTVGKIIDACGGVLFKFNKQGNKIKYKKSKVKKSKSKVKKSKSKVKKKK